MKIFARLDLDAMPVEASSGAMGGSGSIEFMVAVPSGEDDVVRCPTGDYRANVERATSALPPPTTATAGDLERFPTPGIRTIAALEEAGAPATSQIKSMVMVLDGQSRWRSSEATTSSTCRSCRTSPGRSTSVPPLRTRP